jgi:hypothetical protein
VVVFVTMNLYGHVHEIVVVFVTMNLYGHVHEIGSRGQHEETYKFLDMLRSFKE